MTKSVTLVEFTTFERITPLAAGYLWAYAAKDPEVEAAFTFRIHDEAATADRDKVLADLLARPSDVYALCCYVWNMGLMRWLLDNLAETLPEAQFILGGPQVMSHASHYVPPERENVVVCNGEGERTFHHYLRALMAPGAPDFATVPGVSFWRDGELISTEKPERITDLTEIPSPYTTGLFEPGRYSYAILETNRGCPYNCGFCFWGAATNSKVNRFETDRVLADIDWISENQVMVLYFADANWGMLPRDVEITRYVVESRDKRGYPLMMGMAAAKNKPERVADVTKLLVQGGMLTSQPVSLQSMDPDTLRIIDRSNIRPETYTELHKVLREQSISSYTEMIWPLPGETVASFRRGLTQLCRAHADTIVVYPQLLLHNTPIYQNRERFGIRIRRVPDETAEADVVIGTNWVSEDEYRTGVWIYYAMQSLYSLRGLYYLANHLDSTGVMDFDELFARAAAYFQQRQDTEIGRFFAESVASLGNYYLLNSAQQTHRLLHANRAEFDALLAGFVRTQDFWADPDARGMFELDLLARPYVYRQKPSLPTYEFTETDVTAQPKGTMRVDVRPAVRRLLRELEPGAGIPDGPMLLRHPFRRKLPYRPDLPLTENISYCDGMTIRLREMLPELAPLPVPVG